MQRAHGVGENKGCKNVERRMFSHAHKGRKDDFLRLLLDDFKDRCLFDLVVAHHLLEYGRLQDAETYPKADADKNNRECKGKSPSPNVELIAGQEAKGQYCKVRQEQ